VSQAPLTILVVEDERIIALALEMLIRKLGHRVGASVVSGEAALAALETVRPDLVLMDIHLEGGLDGIETARMIRELGGPPLAYATAYTDPETRARALSTAPLAFLSKPVSPEDIRSLLDRLPPSAQPNPTPTSP
jgi:CheY-like chemotaxis protein